MGYAPISTLATRRKYGSFLSGGFFAFSFQTQGKPFGDSLVDGIPKLKRMKSSY